MTEHKAELSRALVVGHKRDGRCRYDPAAKRELIEAALRPGVSVAGLALRHGINANLLRTWMRQYQQRETGATSVAADNTRPAKNLGSSTSSQSSSVRLRVPSGSPSMPLRSSPRVNTERYSVVAGRRSSQRTTLVFGSRRRSSDRTLVSTR